MTGCGITTPSGIFVNKGHIAHYLLRINWHMNVNISGFTGHAGGSPIISDADGYRASQLFTLSSSFWLIWLLLAVARGLA